jgi:hypothetical protein
VGRTVTLIVYEVIGKVVLYIIGTLLLGAFISGIDDAGDWIFCGAWLVGILVFLWIILP